MIRLPGSAWDRRRRPHVTVRLRWLGRLVTAREIVELRARVQRARDAMRWRA